jgi:mxaA protein
MNKIVIALWSLLVLFTSAVIADEQNQMAAAEIDKAWGLLLGDIVNMQVSLPIAVDDIDESTLPHKGKRYGDWLYIRSTSLNEQLFSIEFQVVNVPPQTTDVTTPALNFRLKTGEFIDIETLPITLSPILAQVDIENGTLPALKPAQTPSFIATTPLLNRLLLALSFAVITGLILLIWNIGWRPRNRKPFAEALHSLRMLRWKHNNDPQQAVRIVHKAFNRTADKTIVASDLGELFTIAPWLKPLQQDIELFYQQSSRHFFSQSSADIQDIKQINELIKACRAKEKLT